MQAAAHRRCRHSEHPPTDPVLVAAVPRAAVVALHGVADHQVEERRVLALVLLNLPEQRSLELVDNVLRWYKEDGRVIRACDPRNLFVMVDAATDERQRVNEILDDQFMRRIYERYPAAYKRDAKFFVGSMDSTGEGDDE